MISRDRANRITADWIAAWNAHDLEAILSHYADALEFTSPLVVKRLGRADGTIRTKVELRRYFSVGLKPGNGLYFELLDVVPGVTGIALYYRNHRGKTVIETMRLDTDGLVSAVAEHYRD
jgi:hypothetical protein